MNKIAIVCVLAGLFAANIGFGQPSPVKSGYIDVPDGKLYYEMAGKGDKTIVLVHDGLVHGAVWDNQFSAFSEMFKVVRYDRRGYGKSPQPDKSYSNVDDLRRVFTSLGINEAVLIGMSAGGGLAIDFTLEHPDKVSLLIVVGAVVSGFGYSEHFITRGGRIEAADYADPQKLLNYIVREDPYEIAPTNGDAREKLWELMKAYPQNIDFTKNRMAKQPDRLAIDVLNEIKIPTLIVVGEYDIPDVFVHAGAIESAIPSAKKIIVRNAGHLVPWEQPILFNKHVISFIDESEFEYVLETQGVDAAVEMINKRRLTDKKWIPFTESRMNILGYRYLQSGKTVEAIKLFKLNVLAYPESSNVHDSLGEAYMVNGDRELSIQSYKRSLTLDPNNQNARDKLKQLE